MWRWGNVLSSCGEVFFNRPGDDSAWKYSLQYQASGQCISKSSRGPQCCDVPIPQICLWSRSDLCLYWSLDYFLEGHGACHRSTGEAKGWEGISCKVPRSTSAASAWCCVALTIRKPSGKRLKWQKTSLKKCRSGTVCLQRSTSEAGLSSFFHVQLHQHRLGMLVRSQCALRLSELDEAGLVIFVKWRVIRTLLNRDSGEEPRGWRALGEISPSCSIEGMCG